MSTCSWELSYRGGLSDGGDTTYDTGWLRPSQSLSEGGWRVYYYVTRQGSGDGDSTLRCWTLEMRKSNATLEKLIDEK